ncbi:hypothetical protein BY996DRAFT_6505873 [Phakopsora pachyrhizi]|nr:hypothetical protein BY996DRAFT_6505873 [Phakopsora pachyrhizi]
MEPLIGGEGKRIEERAPAHPGGTEMKGTDSSQPPFVDPFGPWYGFPFNTNKGGAPSGPTTRQYQHPVGINKGGVWLVPTKPPSLSPQTSLQSALKGERLALRGEGIFLVQTSPNLPRLNSQTGAWGNSNSGQSHLQSKYRSKKINQFNPGSIRVPILRN